MSLRPYFMKMNDSWHEHIFMKIQMKFFISVYRIGPRFKRRDVIPYTSSSFSTGKMECHVSSSLVGFLCCIVCNRIPPGMDGFFPGWLNVPAVRLKLLGTHPAAFVLEFSFCNTWYTIRKIVKLRKDIIFSQGATYNNMFGYSVLKRARYRS